MISTQNKLVNKRRHCQASITMQNVSQRCVMVQGTEMAMRCPIALSIPTWRQFRGPESLTELFTFFQSIRKLLDVACHHALMNSFPLESQRTPVAQGGK